ncbi:MAG: hypothetical protein ABSC94_16930 [Polyangiaceae bacterium]
MGTTDDALRRSPLSGVVLLVAALASGCGLAANGLANPAVDAGGDGVEIGPEAAVNPTLTTGSSSRQTHTGTASAMAHGASQSTASAETSVAALDAASAPPSADATIPDGAVDDAWVVHDAQESDADGGSVGACATSMACPVVPPGWVWVAFAESQIAPCPAGFNGIPIDIDEEPDAATACACASDCTVTVAPSCMMGPVGFNYDPYPGLAVPQCGTGATALMNDPAGVCGTDVPSGLPAVSDVQFIPPPPSGGTCSIPGLAMPSNVTYAAQDRACTIGDASAPCMGDGCLSPIENPYRACILSQGRTACPDGFAEGHFGVTGLSFSCSNCGCSVTGQCSGTITFYEDMSCGMARATLAADGTCQTVPPGRGSYSSYIYAASDPQSVDCEYEGGSNVQELDVQGMTTVCCPP